MKIAILGAGFYGLHIGSRLLGMGLDVDVYEREASIFSGASAKNQFRLHQGFHYARNFRTRTQSRDGFFRFIERYGDLTREVPNNFYLVPKGDSLIDFQTYKSIMTSSGLSFRDSLPPKDIVFDCGAIVTDERVLLVEKARQLFLEKMGSKIQFNWTGGLSINEASVLIAGRNYNYLIDCTWGHNRLPEGFFYESTLLLYFRLKDGADFNKALTFVDGPLWSIYPTEDEHIFTLSSVPYTPIVKSRSLSEVRESINRFSGEDLRSRKSLMLRQVERYFPNFQEIFEFRAPQFSIKTKPTGDDDDRSCYVSKLGPYITVLSGKIDNIFEASHLVGDMIGL